MTAQEALWDEPLWTDAYDVGMRVRNRWTGNTGTVQAIEPGRRLLVKWSSTSRWPDYLCRHGSDQGLEVLA